MDHRASQGDEQDPRVVSSNTNRYPQLNGSLSIYIRSNDDPFNTAKLQPHSRPKPGYYPLTGTFKALSEPGVPTDSAYGTASARDRRSIGNQSVCDGTIETQSTLSGLTGFGEIQLQPNLQEAYGQTTLLLQPATYWSGENSYCPSACTAGDLDGIPVASDRNGTNDGTKTGATSSGGIVANTRSRPPLVCPTCQESVKTQSELQKHINRHTRPYICDSPVCKRQKRGFGTQSDLDRHKIGCLKDQSLLKHYFRCQHGACAKKAKKWPRWDNFKTHLKSVHQIEGADVSEYITKNTDPQDNDLAGLLLSSITDASHGDNRFASSFGALHTTDKTGIFTGTPKYSASEHLDDPGDLLQGRFSPSFHSDWADMAQTLGGGVSLGAGLASMVHPSSSFNHFSANSTTTTSVVDDRDQSHSVRTLHKASSPGGRAVAGTSGLSNYLDLSARNPLQAEEVQRKIAPAKPQLPTTALANPTIRYNDGLIDSRAMAASIQERKHGNASTYTPEHVYPKDKLASDENMLAVGVQFGNDISHPLCLPEMIPSQEEKRVPPEIDDDDMDGGSQGGDDVRNEQNADEIDDEMNENDGAYGSHYSEDLGDNEGPHDMQVDATESPTQQNEDLPPAAISEDAIDIDQFKKIAKQLEERGSLGKIMEEFGMQKAEPFSPAPIPAERMKQESTTKAGGSRSTQNHPCKICPKHFPTKSTLRKHMKRHERPYKCTFPRCEKRFGSKNDWKRHEKGQHIQSFWKESWRCDESVAVSSDGNKTKQRGCDGACGKDFATRDELKDHLSNDHDVADANVLEEKVLKGRTSHDHDLWYWCGFCKKTIQLPSPEAAETSASNEAGESNTKSSDGRTANYSDKTADVMAPRFDHIDAHFMSRPGLKTESAQWADGGCPILGWGPKPDPSPTRDTDDVHIGDPPPIREDSSAQVRAALKSSTIWYCCDCDNFSVKKNVAACVQCGHVPCDSCGIE